MKSIRKNHIKAHGELGRRLHVTARKMVSHIDLEAVFATHFKHPVPEPGMRYGFVGYGMFLDALVKAAAVLRTSEVIECKQRLLAELAATARTDGRISIYADGTTGYWDTHEAAYILTAYSNDYLLFSEADSLLTAIRLGDYLLENKVKTTIGIELGLLLLYEASGEKRFLDYCVNELKLESPPEVYEQILSVNNVYHVYTYMARAVAQLKYGELTGRYSDNLLAGARTAFDRILNQGQVSISGCCTGPGREDCDWGEVWDDTQRGVGNWGETCATAYLLRLAAAMQRFEPSVRLADLIERTMYNGFFAAQSVDGMKQRYFTAHEEPRVWYGDEYYCCPNNFRRMMFELPGAIFHSSGSVFTVNLHTAATAEFGAVRISQSGDYPFDSHTELVIDTTEPVEFTLRVAVPVWCSDFQAEMDGNIYYATAGTFFELRRVWHGKKRIRMEFPMEIRLVRGRESQAGRVALMRGPLLYGYNPELNGGRTDIRLDTVLPIVFAEGTLRAFEADGTPLIFTPFVDPGSCRTYMDTTGEGVLICKDDLFQKDESLQELEIIERRA